MRRIGLLLVAAAWLVALAGCSSTEVLVAHSVGLEKAEALIPEAELLDVAVVTFDPGVPDGLVEPAVAEALLKEGTFIQIRRMESVYMTVVLRDTLRKTGHWGAVWASPEETQAADLNVTAQILQSDGDLFELRVKAVDATGRLWLDRKYDMETPQGVFDRRRYPDLDPYQDVFHRVANDLSAARELLSSKAIHDIRELSAMRYAAELSPEAFAAYLEQNSAGRYELTRLPASDDPMFDRTQRVRQRDRLFIETLEQHYDRLFAAAQEDYDVWRESTRLEMQHLRELRKSTRWRTGLGIATIIASVAYGMNSSNDSFGDRAVRDALMYVGVDLMRTRQLRREERRIVEESLEELSTDFDSGVAPLVVTLEETEHRLTGTAEAQYDEWQRMLREIYIDETGFMPEDVSIRIEEEQPLEPGIDILPALEPAPSAPEAAPARIETQAASDATLPFHGGV